MSPLRKTKTPATSRNGTARPRGGDEKHERAHTPADLGFRRPAEWEPHAATWLAWPHAKSDWPGKFGPIPWVYGEIVRRLTPGERVRILVQDPGHATAAKRIIRRVGADMSQVDFFEILTDRSWMRDASPLYLKGADGEIALTDWKFNGWTKYPDHGHDDAIPPQIAVAQKRRRFAPTWPIGAVRRVVLEGGAVDGNGAGTVLATEECLLSKGQERNPGLTKPDVEGFLGAWLGAKKVLWLAEGIVGGDTHGHVDDLARFVGPATVVLCRERDQRDANHARLEDNLARLQGATDQDERPLKVVPLPMPQPVYLDGQRLPASYANFYIANTVVLCPTFNDPADRVALATLGELFPTRQVVGIHALDLVWGGGGIHSVALDEPA